MEKWTETDDFSERLLQQYEGVLKHVLYHLGIAITNSNYDDYLQMGRVFILEVYQKKGGTPLMEPDCYAYCGYLKRGFKWLILHELSRENRRLYQEQQERMLSHRKKDQFLMTDTTVDDQLTMERYFQSDYCPLTKRQQRLIYLLSEGIAPGIIQRTLYHNSRSAYRLDLQKIRNTVTKSDLLD